MCFYRLIGTEAQRQFAGTNIAIYRLPWGTATQDEIAPVFEYMPGWSRDVTSLVKNFVPLF